MEVSKLQRFLLTVFIDEAECRVVAGTPSYSAYYLNIVRLQE
jgi:hypothetical protein